MRLRDPSNAGLALQSGPTRRIALNIRAAVFSHRKRLRKEIGVRSLTPEAPTRHHSLQERWGVLPLLMSLAYRIVFECPNGHNINLQKKCGSVSLSETEAIKLFGDEDLSCLHANCG